MTKKILITGIIVFAIICSAIFAIFYMNRKKQSQGTQAPAQISLPVLPGTQTVEIDIQNISQSIQDNITKAETSNQEVLDTKFRDMKNQPLSLEQFKTGTGITIKAEIYNNLDQKDFSVFTCGDEEGVSGGLGLITRFKSGTTAAYYADLYRKMDKDLADWEEIMFSDLSPLLFPDKKISQRPVFKSTKYTTENGAAKIDVRYANIKSDDGENLSIDYAVFEENIYIFNNPQCLRKALDKYEPVLEP